MLQMVRKKAPGSTVAENTSLSDYTRFRLGDKYEIWGELDGRRTRP